MKERNYFFAIILFLLGLASCQSERKDFRVNMLWLTCEDISPFLGSYGDSEATTPNLDKLATEGVRYTNFYANAPVCAPARFTILTGVHAASAGTMNMRSQYAIPESWKTYPELLREAGYYCTNNSKTDYNFKGNWDVWDESSSRAHYKNRQPGQPFFAIFNVTVSHESRIHNYQPDELIHQPEDMVIPPYVPDQPEVRQDMAKLYDNITRMDSMMGVYLSELKNEGLEDSTIVFFYSDHGGVFPRSKRFIHRTGTWVPLIIKTPEVFQVKNQQQISERLVSFVDLAPTVLSIAGIEPPEYMEGKAFMGAFTDDPQEEILLFRNRMDERIDCMRAITDGKFRYQRNFMPHRPYGQHIGYLWRAAGMRVWEQAWKNGECNAIQSVFWKEKPFEELYNMEADPWEIQNLTNDPGYEDVLTSMRQNLTTKMLELNDAGLIPEGRLAQMDIPYEDKSKDYPLKQILELTPANYAENLTNDQPLVRFWSAVYASSDKNPDETTIESLELLLDDSDPEVRLVAGEALYRSGFTQRGRDAIAAGLKSDNAKVVLLALNIFEYFDPVDQEKLLPAIQNLEVPDDWNYVNRILSSYKN